MARGGNADEEEGGSSAARLYNQADSERPIGTKSTELETGKFSVVRGTGEKTENNSKVENGSKCKVKY